MVRETAWQGHCSTGYCGSGANRAAKETHTSLSFKYTDILKMFAKTLPLHILPGRPRLGPKYPRRDPTSILPWRCLEDHSVLPSIHMKHRQLVLFAKKRKGSWTPGCFEKVEVQDEKQETGTFIHLQCYLSWGDPEPAPVTRPLTTHSPPLSPLTDSLLLKAFSFLK